MDVRSLNLFHYKIEISKKREGVLERVHGGVMAKIRAGRQTRATERDTEIG